jgi:DUF4097 and DUF4098 domain-containing protein YvlB
VSVRCPEGSSLIVGTASGAVDLSGKLGDVRVTTGSGAVTLGEAARADLRLASAPVQVGKCEGLRIHSASGDVRIGSGGDVEIALLSGKIEVGDVRKVRVRAASAPVSLGVRGDTEVETISGRVRVAVARGLRPLVRSRSLSGRRRNTCPEGNDLQVLIRTISGDIEVVPA